MIHMTSEWALTILGAPRTKKNHGSVIVRMRNGKPHRYHVPSEAYQAWEISAKIIRPPGLTWPLPAIPLNCRAIFYRDRAAGDLIGYLQGLGDFLKARGIIRDDVWLMGFDGSRPAVDLVRPRVELLLTRMDEITLALLPSEGASIGHS